MLIFWFLAHDGLKPFWVPKIGFKSINTRQLNTLREYLEQFNSFVGILGDSNNSTKNKSND